MNNMQEIFLFPVRDAEARRQFLIACAIALAMFIVPIIPMFLLMGYCAKIMRQVIDEGKSPSMPAWQGSDWSEMLLDGLRLYGAQIALMLPLFLLMGCGMISIFGGTVGFAAIAEDHGEAFGVLSSMLLMAGMIIFMVFTLLSMPYSIIISAALPHVATKRSFQAAFDFKEWFAIFRKGLGQFILGYIAILVASFIFTVIIQIATMTIVLICIIPIIMIPYVAYQMLVMNTIFAQAYVVGRNGLQPA